MANQWCRLYRETVVDPKLSRLTAAERHVWTVLMCLAIDGDGVVRVGRDIPYTSGELATIAGATVVDVKTAIAWFKQTGMVTGDIDGILKLTHWGDRQFKSDHDAAERKRRSRDKYINSSRDSHVTVTHQNRTEQNRTEQTQNNARKRAVFVKPSIADITAYCHSKNITIDAETFIDFYESKGWRIGNSPMKSWQAAVRNWHRRQVTTAPKKKLDPGSAEYWQNLPTEAK